jgi:hypothetical protein
MEKKSRYENKKDSTTVYNLACHFLQHRQLKSTVVHKCTGAKTTITKQRFLKINNRLSDRRNRGDYH